MSETECRIKPKTFMAPLVTSETSELLEELGDIEWPRKWRRFQTKDVKSLEVTYRRRANLELKGWTTNRVGFG